MAHIERRGDGRWRALYRECVGGVKCSRTCDRNVDAERFLTSIGQGTLVTEILDRANTYDQGVNSALARGLVLDHYVGWGRSMRDPSRLCLCPDFAQRVVTLADATIAASSMES